MVSQSAHGTRLTNTVGILDGTPLSDTIMVTSMDSQHYAHQPHRSLPIPPYPMHNPHGPALGNLGFDMLPSQAAPLSVALDYMAYSSEPLMLTDCIGRICSANKPWVDLCGYTCAEIEGRTCSILQGEETDQREVEALNFKTRKGERAEATVVNYKKGNRRFLNNVTILPLQSPGSGGAPDASFFIARLKEVGA